MEKRKSSLGNLRVIGKRVYDGGAGRVCADDAILRFIVQKDKKTQQARGIKASVSVSKNLLENMGWKKEDLFILKIDDTHSRTVSYWLVPTDDITAGKSFRESENVSRFRAYIDFCGLNQSDSPLSVADYRGCKTIKIVGKIDMEENALYFE